MIIKYIMSVLVMLTFAAALEAAPSNKQVVLKPFTSLTVYIPPGMGVKFTLPFIINEEESFTPFSSVITNPAFKQPARANKNIPTNSFTVYLPGDVRPGTRGNLFFNIAGYEVTAELIASNHRKKHKTDYTFRLGKGARKKLIRDLVAQKTKALEADYKRRIKKNEHYIEQEILKKIGDLLVDEPAITSVKQETNVVLGNGDEVSVYVDETQQYGQYLIIPFEISLNSRSETGAGIRGMKLFTRDFKTKKKRVIQDAVFVVGGRIEPGRTLAGVVTVFLDDIDSRRELSLNIKIERQDVEVIW